MTKSELIARLAARYPQLVAKDAELAVKVILDAMAKSLSEGQRMRSGVWKFRPECRPPRVVEAKSGEKVRVPRNMYRISRQGKKCVNSDFKS
jgi:integration host factor subunit beta